MVSTMSLPVTLLGNRLLGLAGDGTLDDGGVGSGELDGGIE